MKKSIRRIVSVLLIAIMAIAATMILSGCESEISVGETTDDKAISITITGVKGENTTDEAIKSVENALNAITESQYNVHVVLRMYTKEEYEQKIMDVSASLDAKFREVEDANPKWDDQEILKEVYGGNKIELDEDINYGEKANGDIVIFDEYGIMSTVFPTAAEEQLDIVLVNSLSMYNKMNTYSETKSMYLAQLDALVTNNAPVINKYVNAAARGRINKANAGTFAMPNNQVYGQFEYLLIDRELFDKYGYNIDMITQVSDIEQYIYDVAANETDVAPLYNYNGLKWLTFYEGDPVLLVKPAVTTVDTEVSQYPTSILGYSLFKKTTSMLYNLKKQYNFIPEKTKDIDFSSKWGAAFISGDTTIPDKYSEDYYVVTLQRPYIENDMYESMYGISTFCQYPDRCTEILSLFETNPEFVNILAYGIEGTNYDLDKNGVVINRRGGWDMDVRYSGNNFLLKQNEDMTEQELAYSADDWALGKLQNTKAVMSMYTGFELKYETRQDHVDPATGKPYVDPDTDIVIGYILVGDTVEGIYDLTKDIFARIDAFDGSYVDKNGETVECGMEQYLVVLAGELESNKYFQSATLSGNYKKNTTWAPQAQYTAFFLRVYG